MGWCCVLAGLPGAAAALDPQMPRGKAGVDRFEMDLSRVEEKRLGDGTVIVRLNGEGMEKIVLAEGSGPAQAVCGAALERRLARTAGIPEDFRGRSGAKAGAHASDR